MKNLNYRQPSGKKPFYKRWKFYAYTFGAIVLLGLILDLSGYTAKQDAIKAEEEAVKAAEIAAKDEERAKEAAEREASLKRAERLNNEREALEVSKVLSRDEEISKLASGYIEEYKGSETIEIKVNENVGADDGSYIVLAYMSYPTQISAERTRKMIEMFSSDLAANLAKESDVSEVAVFWEVPKFLKSGNAAKYAYERLGEGMRLADEVIAAELQ